jgi:geranylgeranyl transferase type-1 subunit beta
VLSLEIPTGGWSPSSLYAHFPASTAFHLPHIVFTYSAVNVLALTGGLARINRDACLRSVALCAKEDGSYSSFATSEEADLRFVYSAVAICHALNDFTGMQVERVVNYIHSCRNFDGGYGLRPHCESHSGAIYCALASLKMLERKPEQPRRTLAFLANRQATNLNSSALSTQTRN